MLETLRPYSNACTITCVNILGIFRNLGTFLGTLLSALKWIQHLDVQWLPLPSDAPYHLHLLKEWNAPSFLTTKRINCSKCGEWTECGCCFMVVYSVHSQKPLMDISLTNSTCPVLKGFLPLALGAFLFCFKSFAFGSWNLSNSSSLPCLEVIYFFFLVCLNAVA